MAPVAWLVIGQGHHHAVFLDQSKAAAQAVQLRGVLKPLVLMEQVSEIVAAAYQHGLHSLIPQPGVAPWPGAAVMVTVADERANPQATQQGGQT